MERWWKRKRKTKWMVFKLVVLTDWRKNKNYIAKYTSHYKKLSLQNCNSVKCHCSTTSVSVNPRHFCPFSVSLLGIISTQTVTVSKDKGQQSCEGGWERQKEVRERWRPQIRRERQSDWALVVANSMEMNSLHITVCIIQTVLRSLRHSGDDLPCLAERKGIRLRSTPMELQTFVCPFDRSLALRLHNAVLVNKTTNWGDTKLLTSSLQCTHFIFIIISFVSLSV